MATHLFKGRKQCNVCGQILHQSEFHNSRSSKDGLFPTCKLCVKKRDATRNRAAEWARRTKLCKKCGTVKSYPEFSRRKASKDGLQPHCKSCQAIAAKNHALASKKAEQLDLRECEPTPAPAPTVRTVERINLQPTVTEFIELVGKVRELQAEVTMMKNVVDRLVKEKANKTPAKKKTSWWGRAK